MIDRLHFSYSFLEGGKLGLYCLEGWSVLPIVQIDCRGAWILFAWIDILGYARGQKFQACHNATIWTTKINSLYSQEGSRREWKLRIFQILKSLNLRATWISFNVWKGKILGFLDKTGSLVKNMKSSMDFGFQWKLNVSR